MNRDSQWSKHEACFACANQVLLTVNHYDITPVSLLANGFDARSVLHWKVKVKFVSFMRI